MLGDFNAPGINWACKAAPEDTFGYQLLRFVHLNRMAQHVTQATRRRFSQVASVLHLMITRTPNGIESLELEKPIGRSDHAVTPMRLILQGLVSPDKYEGNFLGMDKSRLSDLGLQARWEVKRSSNYVDRQWEAFKSNLLAVTNLVAPIHRIK